MVEYVAGYAGTGIEISTDLDPEEVRNRLEDASREPTSWDQKLPPVRVKSFGSRQRKFLRPVEIDPDPPFAGVVDDADIKLWLRTRDPELWEPWLFGTTSYTKFFPIFRGSLETQDGKTVLRGKVTVHRLVSIVFAAIVGMALITEVRFLATSGLADSEFWWPLLAIAGLVVAARFGVYRGRREVPVLRRHLQEILANDTEGDESDGVDDVEDDGDMSDAVHHW